MSQANKLYELLKDGKPHRTDEIVREVYNQDQTSIARISARIHDIKRKYVVEINSWPDPKNKKMWFYQLATPVPVSPQSQYPQQPGQGIALFPEKPKGLVPNTLFPMLDENVA